jgi:ribosomal protein S25
MNIGDGGKKKWEEHFFQWPEELPRMLTHLEVNYKQGNTYFCPQLMLTKDRPPGAKSPRVKENIAPCTVAWADLDTCSPELMLVEPSVVVLSSDNRYQALWVFEQPIDPADAEQISKNIAYHHVSDGADGGGWDLTQMLRVPHTYNMKRDIPFRVKTLKITKVKHTIEDFNVYKESRISSRDHDPMPQVLPTETPLDILQKYRRSLNPVAFSIFDVTPQITEVDGGWSKVLWQLIMLLFEAGLSREEVFVVASDAACNKYKRDGKHPKLLWEEVCRAYQATVEKLNILVPETVKQAPLITQEELDSISHYHTFIDRYVSWASRLGDAATQYHHAGAFMILSSLLAGTIRLPTSFGVIMPNMWFMLLADTTLTRKSTAMDIAMDIVDQVDDTVLLATDGSLEGLMQSLEIRPGKPSMFLRDEFSGLIESMTRKDYMAGMAEALTKLYDGKTMKRVLKRETVTVREPCLLIFGGGIKTRVQSLLTLEHVASGFVPRFIFITAESDVSRLQPLGPPTPDNLAERDEIVEELMELRDRYVFDQEIVVKGKAIGVSESRIMASLTEEAWARYNILEATMLYAGVNSDQPDIMTPVYDRLAKSILKASVLIAASNQKERGEVIVTLNDLLTGLKYGSEWLKYSTEIVNGIGRTANEQLLQRIMQSIRRHKGVSRSQLMQWYHLEARQAEIIFNTLEQRGMIIATRMGRTWVYDAVGRIRAE